MSSLSTKALYTRYPDKQDQLQLHAKYGKYHPKP